MKQKHLIALDLDGTLLSDDKKILRPTKQIITQLMDDGHIVVIATGRSNRLSILYYNELRLTTPLINSNGAIIHHPLDPSWGSFHTPLEHKTALDIIDVSFQLNSKNILAAVKDAVYLENYDQHIMDFYKPTENDPFHIGGLVDKLQDDPTLMLLYPNEDTLPQLTSYLDDSHASIIDHRNWGEPFNIIEVTNKSVNKAIALHRVAKEYGIPKERIIAFGDELNDLAMIDYAGVGVAMGNAVEAVKSIANYVADTNEKNGIGIFLADYFSLSYPIIQAK